MGSYKSNCQCRVAKFNNFSLLITIQTQLIQNCSQQYVLMIVLMFLTFLIYSVHKINNIQLILQSMNSSQIHINDLKIVNPSLYQKLRFNLFVNKNDISEIVYSIVNENSIFTNRWILAIINYHRKEPTICRINHYSLNNPPPWAYLPRPDQQIDFGVIKNVKLDKRVIEISFKNGEDEWDIKVKNQTLAAEWYHLISIYDKRQRGKWISVKELVIPHFYFIEPKQIESLDQETKYQELTQNNQLKLQNNQNNQNKVEVDMQTSRMPKQQMITDAQNNYQIDKYRQILSQETITKEEKVGYMLSQKKKIDKIHEATVSQICAQNIKIYDMQQIIIDNVDEISQLKKQIQILKNNLYKKQTENAILNKKLKIKDNIIDELQQKLQNQAKQRYYLQKQQQNQSLCFTGLVLMNTYSRQFVKNKIQKFISAEIETTSIIYNDYTFKQPNFHKLIDGICYTVVLIKIQGMGQLAIYLEESLNQHKTNDQERGMVISLKKQKCYQVKPETKCTEYDDNCLIFGEKDLIIDIAKRTVKINQGISQNWSFVDVENDANDFKDEIDNGTYNLKRLQIHRIYFKQPNNELDKCLNSSQNIQNSQS